MARSVGKLFLQLVVALFVSTLAARIAIEISFDGGLRNVVLFPGTPLDAPEARAIIEEYRLDQPLLLQHIGWCADAITGDFGRSYRNRGIPVSELINPRLPITFQLSMTALFVALLIGIPAGMTFTALQHRPTSRVIELVFDVFRSFPVFILAPFLTYIFALRLQWLPIFGWERVGTSLTGNLRSMVLPMMALALPEAALIARLIKSGLQEVGGQEYLVAAKAKGLPRRHVYLHHALRPASLTTVTQIGLILGTLLGGAVVVEQIFAIGGMGVLLFESIISRDLNVLLATAGFLTGLIVLIRGLSEIAYRALDPRIT